MSLLNQVLRDLDHRQVTEPTVASAVTAAAPVAPVAPVPRVASPGARQRLSRWALGAALTAAAVVAGGVAQGSLRWPGRGAEPAPVAVAVATPRAPAASPAAPAAASLPAGPATPLPSPIHAMTAPAPAASAAVKPAPVTASLAPAPRVEPEHKRPEATKTLAPSVPASIAAPQLATTPSSPATLPAPSSLPLHEPRIDKRASARTPQERAEAHYQRGVTAHQSGHIDEAASTYAAALREDPAHAAARLALAGLLIGQSRQPEAQALLQQGHALDPRHAGLASMLARLHAERQEWPAALDTLAAASPAAAQDADFHGLHAAILQRAQRHAEAAERYGAALRLKPAQGVWWMGLGISLAETGQHDAARAAFERARAMGLPEGAASYVEARLRQIG